MSLSKKELSILIEVIYSIVFALIFLPYFYENQEKNLTFDGWFSWKNNSNYNKFRNLFFCLPMLY